MGSREYLYGYSELYCSMLILAFMFDVLLNFVGALFVVGFFGVSFCGHLCVTVVLTLVDIWVSKCHQLVSHGLRR